jgi:hypothetical protein
MGAAMDRARKQPRRRLAGWMLVGLGLLATGCANMQARRESRQMVTPPMLGRRADSASRAALARTGPAPADPVAARLTPRVAEAGLLADAPPVERSAPQQVVTRSTAPPRDAVLPAAPIAVATSPAVAEPAELAPLPPLQEPPAEPARPQAKAQNDLDQIRSLVREARTQLAPLRNYSVRMTRQERVGDQLQPEETVLLSIRREPRAVRLEWTEGENAGREVLYAAAPNGGMMHIRMANPLLPRMSLPPDSPLALRNSRHPITEAGLDAVLEQLEATVTRHESGQAPGERLTYEGLRTPVPGGPPCHTIQRVMADGEVWIVALDAQTYLPLLVQDKAPDGSLLERYVFRDAKTDLPELMADTAFDPDARWGASRGILGRLAGATPTDAAPAATATR